MSAPLPLVAGVGLLGLVIGSFLNVVVYRVPRQESIVSPGSHCPSCDAPIKGRHNVPVLSWLVLRGRCHSCRGRISLRYPLVEAGTAALFVAITLRFGFSVELPAYLYLGAIGVCLALIDVDVRRLPDTIVLPSYVVSILLLLPAGASAADRTVPVRALAGMVALLILFFALAAAYPNGLTFGDVKLAGLVGLYLGWLSWTALFLTAVGSLVIAAMSGVAVLATKHGSRYVAVPLAPCLIGAGVLSVFVAAPLSSWYGSLIPA
jgi:leader peptidase (prepilin peptidase)/N-methyltransferase